MSTLLMVATYRQRAVDGHRSNDTLVHREEHTTTVLADGRVLVVGGLDSRQVLATTELYDPREDRWTAAAQMSVARRGHTATLLSDGRVLVAGGMSCLSACRPSDYLFSTEVYDPTINQWLPASSMNYARSSNAAARLTDGRILVSGLSLSPGKNGDVDLWTNSAESYDPISDMWQMIASSPIARVPAEAFVLPDGRVAIAGGRRYPAIDRVWEVEIFDPVSESWRVGKPAPIQGLEPWFGMQPDGRIVSLVFGKSTIDIQVYDPWLDSWSVVATDAPGNFTATIVSLGDGSVMLCGGTGANGTSIRAVGLLIVDTGEWRATGSLMKARTQHSLVVLQDGSVLAFGGIQWRQGTDGSAYAVELQNTERYERDTERWR